MTSITASYKIIVRSVQTFNGSFVKIASCMTCNMYYLCLCYVYSRNKFPAVSAFTCLLRVPLLSRAGYIMPLYQRLHTVGHGHGLLCKLKTCDNSHLSTNAWHFAIWLHDIIVFGAKCYSHKTVDVCNGMRMGRRS